MLAELILRLATPADRMTRRLGLVGESVALWSRGLRQRKAWAEHHRRCREAVAAIVAELPAHRTVAVLGSGFLRDVPLDVLCGRFERVVLVDAVHLLPVRLRLLGRRNVTCITRDLTGVMGWLAGARQGRCEPLADLAADPRLDLVVSANLLSQLAWPVADWLDEHPDRAATLPPDLPAACIRWHLDDLARLATRVCLISDTLMTVSDRDGAVIERLDLLRGVELPAADEGWVWPVAPFGEAERGREHRHDVRLWRDFGQATAGR